MSWRARAREIQECPSGALTEPTKPPSVAFVSTQTGQFHDSHASERRPDSPAERSLDRRRARVERDLAAHPEQRVAADVADTPLHPEAGAPVSVVIACRTAAGIVSAELHVPRERFDAALFLATLSATSERPS